jgi:hypothetical protein
MSGAHRMHRRDDKYMLRLVRKPERRSSFGNPRHRWEDNIKMDKSVRF